MKIDEKFKIRYEACETAIRNLEGIANSTNGELIDIKDLARNPTLLRGG